jgi:hypothetical protein
MTPTKEREAILASKGRDLLINARAGTGKTTTLKMIASAHPDLKIVYLVFNRKAKEEAYAKFPTDVEIRTVHSLAFAGDAMKSFPFDEKQDLTMSFRFGKQIADLASVFIRELYLHPEFKAILNSGWQEALKRHVPARVPKPSQAHRRVRKRRALPRLEF